MPHWPSQLLISHSINSSMIILSWNSRGLGARIKRSQVRKLTNTHSPSFIFIQETKIESFHPKSIKSIWPDEDINWYSSPSIGTSGGILSLWKTNFFVLETCHVDRNWIAVCGFIPSIDFHCALINLYNQCSIAGRATIWNDIFEFKNPQIYPPS